MRWRRQGLGPRFLQMSERIVRYPRADLMAFITDKVAASA